MTETSTHMETRRYCERCGAQIEGDGAWGHDDNCPIREAKPTRAQIAAAKAIVRRDAAAGRASRPAVVKIAQT